MICCEILLGQKFTEDLYQVDQLACGWKEVNCELLSALTLWLCKLDLKGINVIKVKAKLLVQIEQIDNGLRLLSVEKIKRGTHVDEHLL